MGDEDEVVIKFKMINWSLFTHEAAYSSKGGVEDCLFNEGSYIDSLWWVMLKDTMNILIYF